VVAAAVLFAPGVVSVSFRSEMVDIERVNDSSIRFDPNIASADELMLLPRIGPKLAGDIIIMRSEIDRTFRTVADLEDVRNIGPKTSVTISPYLKFPDQANTNTGPER